MKDLIKIILFGFVALGSWACEKADELPFYENGKAVTVIPSATSIAPAPADSNAVALTLNWTEPGYATDSANIKYVIEVAEAGKNFENAVTREVAGNRSITFTAGELNSIALGYGFEFNETGDLEFRVISSYANNNERINSNAVNIQYTPYKIPPKVVLPESGMLFIVGDATVSDWTNKTSVVQEFSRLDETTFAGVFLLTAGRQYLVLTENENWDKKYSLANNQIPGVAEGGEFGYNLNDNFVSPATTGWYKITLDFQKGTYAVTPFDGNLPASLFIVGDATPGGWSNPVPEESQKFERLNSSEFELTLDFTGGGNYILLPVNGSWDYKYAVEDASAEGANMGGNLLHNLGQDIPGPKEAGSYKLTVNFAAGAKGTYRLEKL